MQLHGRAFKYGDDVNTDEIIPARYLNTFDAQELAHHCMEDIDIDFAHEVKEGDIIVAQKNFGCGSSREHAPIAIKGCGIVPRTERTFSISSAVIDVYMHKFVRNRSDNSSFLAKIFLQRG